MLGHVLHPMLAEAADDPGGPAGPVILNSSSYLRPGTTENAFFVESLDEPLPSISFMPVRRAVTPSALGEIMPRMVARFALHAPDEHSPSATPPGARANDKAIMTETDVNFCMVEKMVELGTEVRCLSPSSAG